MAAAALFLIFSGAWSIICFQFCLSCTSSLPGSGGIIAVSGAAGAGALTGSGSAIGCLVAGGVAASGGAGVVALTGSGLVMGGLGGGDSY
ncbi:hypothetical protein ES703_103477 [subsurface metagenome]